MDARTATAAAAAVLVTGCGGAPDPGDEATGAALEGAAELGMEHVHGLGVDPADGVLYAATHFGLFRVPEQGPVQRVADRFQDTMAFTVVGPRTFLGSGHPDFRKDPGLPPRLGLIRSTDAGQTWDTVSLTGQADLHVLEPAGGTLYAADSATGRLLASSDQGRTWQARAALTVTDLAADPAAPDRLLAASEQGLLVSTDGGGTFTPSGGPAASALAWAAEGLYAVDAEGQVFVSTDGGATWQARGVLGGAPQALAVTGSTVVAAAEDRGILASTDGGRTWTVRYGGP